MRVIDEQSWKLHIELLEKKIRDGWRPDVAPQGYLNDRVTESGFRRIFTDPERMTFIREIFELHYQGRSVTEIPMATTVDSVCAPAPGRGVGV